MAMTLVKAASDGIVTGKENMTKKATEIDQAVDFGILTVREIRDVLKSKAHCLRAGFPAEHMIIQTLNEFRDHYARRVGLPTYLSQMLGELGKAQIQYCDLYNESGQRLGIRLNGNHNQPVQRFIASHFQINQLPFRVEVRQKDQPDRIEVRYL